MRAERTYSDEAWAFARVERAVRHYQGHCALECDNQAIHYVRVWLRDKAAAYRALAKKAEGSGRDR